MFAASRGSGSGKVSRSDNPWPRAGSVLSAFLATIKMRFLEIWWFLILKCSRFLSVNIINQGLSTPFVMVKITCMMWRWFGRDFMLILLITEILHDSWKRFFTISTSVTRVRLYSTFISNGNILRFLETVWNFEISKQMFVTNIRFLCVYIANRNFVAPLLIEKVIPVL